MTEGEAMIYLAQFNFGEGIRRNIDVFDITCAEREGVIGEQEARVRLLARVFGIDTRQPIVPLPPRELLALAINLEKPIEAMAVMERARKARETGQKSYGGGHNRKKGPPHRGSHQGYLSEKPGNGFMGL